MRNIFTGIKAIIKKDGTVNGRRWKQKVAENIEHNRQQEYRKKVKSSEDNIRKEILKAIDYLSRKNKELADAGEFNPRIENHRHNPLEEYSIVFRVGGNGKRYSKKICGALAKTVVPILFDMWDEQKKLGLERPLTSRMIADLVRIRAEYAY